MATLFCTLPAKYGNCNIINFLLNHGAEVDAANKNGSNPIMLAMEHRHKPASEMLLLSGANIYLKNLEGRCAADLRKVKDVHAYIMNLKKQITDV